MARVVGWKTEFGDPSKQPGFWSINRPSDGMMGASVNERPGRSRRVVVGILASLLALVVVFLARSSAHRADASAALATEAKRSELAPYAIPSELVKALPIVQAASAPAPFPEPAVDADKDVAIADRVLARKQARPGTMNVSRRPAGAIEHVAGARSKVARVDEAASPTATTGGPADAAKTGESAKNRVPLVDDRRRVTILE